MIITRTPYRVSLAGGGTDFPAHFREHGGMVVSAAIRKHFYTCLTTRLDDNLRLSYFETEFVRRAEELKHEIVRTTLASYGLRSGLEMSMVGEVPAGTGLGSSAAVTAGVVRAVRAYLGLDHSNRALATEAVEIETERLGKPSGWQDQFGVVYPGLKAIVFGGGEARVEPLALSRENQVLLEECAVLVFTGRRRKAASVLKQQVARQRSNLSRLRSLQRVAEETKKALCAERLDLALLGEMLDEGWRAKRTLTDSVTDADLDRMHEKGKAAGAWGGKLLGAGAGGFYLFLVPKERRPELLSSLGDPAWMPLAVDSGGCSIVYDGRQGG